MRTSLGLLDLNRLNWLLVGCTVFALGCSPPKPATPPQKEKAPPIAEVQPEKGEPVTEKPQNQPEAEPEEISLAPETGPELYQRHCAACHGDQGNGQGLAAKYLFPKPRDFQLGRFRLVSTINSIPSHDDLLSVLKRGMPGSSMPPWSHLSPQELELLVKEVQRLHQQGQRNEYVRILVEEEELTDEELKLPEVEEEIAQFVADRTTPGESTEVPEITPANEESLARGKEFYLRQNCNKCHGDTGKGDGGQKMVDDEGFPMTPRDFTRGIFKGGHDIASVYRRIAYGMPGTPMPSSQMKPEEIVDLSHYVLSLSDEKVRQAALQQRRNIVVQRVETLPADSDEEAWENIAATQMLLTPLWWRNEEHPEMTVKAVHDGKSIAILLSWQDDAADRRATRTSMFEDAVAVELFQGPREPFVGMGARQGADVDVWFWDADRQSPSTVEEEYPRVVVDIYPFDEKQVETAEGNRPGAKTENQSPVSLPAVASGNPIVPPRNDSGSGASTLTAGGPQTVTFRMPKNQAVDARGVWSDGTWKVVMKRPLSVLENGGVAMVPGQRVSAAFAVWNGAKNDRDGQKLITIWNDFTLE